MLVSALRRMLGIAFLFVAGSGVAVADEFQAQLVKVKDGKVAFLKSEKRTKAMGPGPLRTLDPAHEQLLDQLKGTPSKTGPLIIMHNAPLLSLPVAKDVKIEARWLNPKTRKVETRELSDGLQNDNLRVIDRRGFPATIVSDDEGTNIKQLLITMPPEAPPGPPTHLERPVGFGDPDADPLPSGAVARLGSTHFQHPTGDINEYLGRIRAYALSQDGRLLAAGGVSLQIMNAENGKTLLEVPCDPSGKLGSYQALAFSEDGKTLACYRPGGRPSKHLVQLIRVEDGKTVMEWALPINIEGGPRSFSTLAFLPANGQLVLEETLQKVVYILDATNGGLVRMIKGVRAPALSRDGQTLAGVSDAGHAICLWDITTGKERLRLDQSKGGAGGLGFSPDGTVLAAALGEPVNGSGGGSRFALWDATNGKLLHQLTDSAAWWSSPKRSFSANVQCFCFAADGKQVVACLHDHMTIWDPVSGKEIRRFPHHIPLHALPKKIAFLPDNNTLLLVEGNRFSFLDAVTGQPRRQVDGHMSPVQAIAYSPHGSYMATVGGDVRVWDARSHRLLFKSDPSAHFPSSYCVPLLAFSPQGNLLAATNEVRGNKILLWNLDSGKQQLALPAFSQPQRALAFSPDGTRLATCGRDGTIRVFDSAQGKLLHGFSVASDERGVPRAVAFSPDLRWVAASAQMGAADVQLWEVGTGKLAKTFTGARPRVSYRLAFSPDSRGLLEIGSMGIWIWELSTGQLRQTAETTRHSVGVCFSPDGRLVANGSATIPVSEVKPAQFSIMLSDLSAKQPPVELTGHRGSSTAVCFSPDGRILAGADWDTTVLLWDVAALAPTTKVKPLSREVRAACWNDLTRDADTAYPSMWKLTYDSGAAEFLCAELKPAIAPDDPAVARLIAELDSNVFAVRLRASQQLARLGATAEEALRKTLLANPSPEMQARLKSLLESAEREQLRGLRAIEVLEQIKSSAARQLLQNLAAGHPGSLLTQEAGLSVKRLE